MQRAPGAQAAFVNEESEAQRGRNRLKDAQLKGGQAWRSSPRRSDQQALLCLPSQVTNKREMRQTNMDRRPDPLLLPLPGF